MFGPVGRAAAGVKPSRVTRSAELLAGVDVRAAMAEQQLQQVVSDDGTPIVHLDGQGHVADLLAPEDVADPLLAFLS
jgi:hypothetical protein